MKEVLVKPDTDFKTIRFEISTQEEASVIVGLFNLSGQLFLLFTWELQQGKNITVQNLHRPREQTLQIGIGTPTGEKLYHSTIQTKLE